MFGISKKLISIFCTISIAILGWWLGEYGWFGGDRANQLTITLVSAFLGVIGSSMLCRRHWTALLVFPCSFVFSQLLFSAFIALGQTLYVIDSGSGDFFQTFALALQGRL